MGSRWRAQPSFISCSLPQPDVFSTLTASIPHHRIRPLGSMPPLRSTRSHMHPGVAPPWLARLSLYLPHQARCWCTSPSVTPFCGKTERASSAFSLAPYQSCGLFPWREKKLGQLSCCCTRGAVRRNLYIDVPDVVGCRENHRCQPRHPAPHTTTGFAS